MRWLLCFPVLFAFCSVYGQNPAQRRIDSLHHVTSLAGTPYTLSNTYAQLTLVYQAGGRPDSARHYLGLLGNLFADNRKDHKIASRYFMTAGLYFQRQGDLRGALPYMTSALEYLDAVEPDPSYGEQLLTIGNTHLSLRNPVSAADYHSRALRVFEKSGNVRGQSLSLRGLGMDLLEQEEYREAEKYFQSALKLQDVVKDARETLAIRSGMAKAYAGMGRYETSADFYERALSQAEAMKLTPEALKTLYSLGMLYTARKNPEQAKRYLLQALSLAYVSGDSVMMTRIKTSLAVVSTSRRRGTDAEKTLVDNVVAATTATNVRSLPDAYYTLAQWYAERKQYEKAFTQLHAYLQLNDTVHRKEALAQYRELEARYARNKVADDSLTLTAENQVQVLERELQGLTTQRNYLTAAVLLVVLLTGIGALLYYRRSTRARKSEKVPDTKVSTPRARATAQGAPVPSASPRPAPRPVAAEPKSVPPAVATLEAALAVQDDETSDQAVVLIIADNAAMRSLMEKTLKTQFRTIVATNENSGWEKAQAQVPDLVITDIETSPADGQNICEKLRDATITSHIPVVMLTANAEQENKAQGLQADADEYISKPFTPEELRLRVQNIIAQRENLRHAFNQQLAQPRDIFSSDPESDFMDSLLEILEERYAEATFDAEAFTTASGLSRIQLHRKLKALTGKSTPEFLRDFKRTRSQQVLAADRVRIIGDR
ncbi:response regulator [Fulvivirgaceae bacterium PWU5]|uniref:Response regulator n=1 Tax=Dawidia cretensis TaxID=2782350 RepID=A0AAP2E383_9BACT|nr:tetratricopeptide repeat protein [Dawidia cretensis]MBT1711234.1 response regulator [Dawidia cretensis]